MPGNQQSATEATQAENYDSIKLLHLELNQAYNLEDLNQIDSALQIYRSLINKTKVLKDPVVKFLLLDQVYFFTANILFYQFKNSNDIKIKNAFKEICSEWAAIQQNFPYAAAPNSYQQQISKFLNPDCKAITHLSALASPNALADFYSDVYKKGLAEGNLLILQICRIGFIRIGKTDLGIQCFEEVIKLDNFQKADPIIKANFYYYHVSTLVDLAKTNPNSNRSIELIEKAYQNLRLAKFYNKKNDPRAHALLLIELIKASPSAKFNDDLIAEAHTCLKQASRHPTESSCDENNMQLLKRLHRAAIAYEQAKLSGNLTAIQAASPGYIELLFASENDSFALKVIEETEELQKQYQKAKPATNFDSVASRENILHLATVYQERQCAHVDPNNSQTKQALADAKVAYKDALRVDIAQRAVKANPGLPLTKDGKYLDLTTMLANSKTRVHIEGYSGTPAEEKSPTSKALDYGHSSNGGIDCTGDVPVSIKVKGTTEGVNPEPAHKSTDAKHFTAPAVSSGSRSAHTTPAAAALGRSMKFARKIPDSGDLTTSAPGSGSGSKFYENYGDYDSDQETTDDFVESTAPTSRPG